MLSFPAASPSFVYDRQQIHDSYSLYYIKMSQLNLFQKYSEEQEFRSLLVLNGGLAAILDYCEYSIRSDFNMGDKQKLKNKNRKKEITEEFTKAFTTLSRWEKIQYYVRVIGYLRNFAKDDFEPPKSPYLGVLNDIGYSRSFSIKRWKEKKLRLDQDRHIMFAERDAKIKTYELKDYLLRLSKNKEYSSFVLQAINNNPQEKSRTVHMGFSDKSTFQKWFLSIKFSVQFREWELYSHLFKGKNAKAVEKLITDDLKFGNKSYYPENVNETMRMEHTGNRNTEDFEGNFLSQSMYVETNKRLEMDNDFFMNEKLKSKNMKIPMKKNEKIESSKEEQQMVQLQKEIKEYEVKKEESFVGKTLVDELIEGETFEEPDVFQDKIEDEDEKSKEVKKNLDLFHKIYPQYELEELEIYLNYAIIHEEENLKIYQNQILQKRLKMVITFAREKHSLNQIISMISKVETLKELNENIQDMQVKTSIPSENSALIYMVLKPFNRLYRSRDFIFLRHIFKSGKQIYMIDKSIENTNYPPFMTIVRGQLCIVYGIFERGDKYELLVDAQITNQGYLNLVQEINLTLKFLKSFNKLPTADIEANSYKLFNLEWDISKNQANQLENEIRSRRKTIKEINKKIRNVESRKEQSSPQPKNFSKKNTQLDAQCIMSEKMQLKDALNNSHERSSSFSPHVVHVNSPNTQKVQVKKFNKKTMEQVGEISLEQANKKPQYYKTTLSIVRELDTLGNVIINQDYLTHKYILSAIQKEKANLIYMDSSEGHPIWKNQWIHDDKEGGIIFIHKKKIEDQKGVLKFILSKMAKNIVSGQSILNISLPVDIFSAESNLQRYLYSMLYGPILLEGLEKESAISKLVKTIIFGITNSVLYLSMEKPFNPIIGQTFQCWINGCPAYAQQISHHPPIGALMFKGRGYSVSAQLQSKISLGVNSGTGTNDGIYRVMFADKTQICFITPGGEVSGLAHGDRRFNFIGKSYYWISNTNIVLQLAFDPFKKGFFSVGKQQQPSDYFEGTVWEVKPDFMTKFLNGKRKQPQEKERVKAYGKISGVWNKYLKFNNEQMFNFEKEYPLVLQFEPHPLPSDANWREDIEYRKRNQVTRAQTEKEKLQIFQRKDRKLREKYQKKK